MRRRARNDPDNGAVLGWIVGNQSVGIVTLVRFPSRFTKV